MAKSRIAFPRLGTKELEKQRMIAMRKFMKMVDSNTTVELDEPIAEEPVVESVVEN